MSRRVVNRIMSSSSPERELAQQLDPGERILWTGRPRQGLRLSRIDVFLIPFSFLWGGFAIFWETTALREDAPAFFVVWGIPFVLIGLYLVIGRFFTDAKRRERTVYALTDRRVIIASGFISKSIKSLDLHTLSDVTLEEEGGGVGTITFGPSLPMWRWFGGAGWPGAGLYRGPILESVTAAREVFHQIRTAQQALR